MRGKWKTFVVAFAMFAALTAMVAPATAAATIKCNGLDATIIGTGGNDTLDGTPGPDVIVGRNGADVIDGKGGGDTICGGNGKDTIYGGPGKDVIIGGAKNDKLYGGNNNDVIRGGLGGDRIWSGKGDDVARGQEGSDLVRGQDGSDTMYGGAGADILDGGNGGDLAIGGGGIDACYFASESLPTTCEPDQLNVSWAADVTATDITEVLYDEDPSTSYIDFYNFTFPNINGVEYARGFGILHEDTDVGESAWYEFDLGRDYRKLAVRVGLRDDSIDTTAEYRMEVIGDDVLLDQVVVGFGEDELLSVDITNVLRLRLKLTSTAGQGNSTALDTWVVWIDPRVAASKKLYPAPPA